METNKVEDTLNRFEKIKKSEFSFAYLVFIIIKIIYNFI